MAMGLFGPSKDEIWRQLAAQLGGRFHDGGFFGRDRLTGRVGEWEITLDTFTVSSGGSSTTYTRMRAPYVNPDNFQFKIYRAGFFTAVGEMFGMRDIETGDAIFDKEFVVKGSPAAKVRAFLQDETLRALIHAQSRLFFEVRDDEGRFRKSFPGDVDELYFRRAGVMKDLGELRALYELFSHTLRRLCELGSARERDPGVRL
jgi:hypothetical protein